MSKCISLGRFVNNAVVNTTHHSVGLSPSHRQPVVVQTMLGDYVAELRELELT
jgi:hypothetical protein